MKDREQLLRELHLAALCDTDTQRTWLAGLDSEERVVVDAFFAEFIQAMTDAIGPLREACTSISVTLMDGIAVGIAPYGVTFTTRDTIMRHKLYRANRKGYFRNA